MSQTRKHELWQLKSMQAADLNTKILLSKTRIREWVKAWGEDGVYISFSGGKDSTVLLDLVRNKCGFKNVPAVFIDTGLEYPEIKEFVKTFDNVTWIKPKMNFRQVIEKYGYPFISKDVADIVQGAKKGQRTRIEKLNGTYRDKNGDLSMFNKVKWAFLCEASFEVGSYCCNVMKKQPSRCYEKTTNRTPFLGQLAAESQRRTDAWMRTGCNAFEGKHPQSNPMAFWTEQDILQYIKQNNLPICSVYGDIVEDLSGTEEVEGQLTFSDLEGIDTTDFDAEKPRLKTTGCNRTGCMFCGFGCYLEKPGEGRFERMRITHPKIYEWIMKPWDEGGLGYKEIIDWINENGNLNIRY